MTNSAIAISRGRFLLKARPDTTFNTTVAENTHFTATVLAASTAIEDVLRVRAYGTWCSTGSFNFRYRWYIGGVLVVDSGTILTGSNVGGVRSPLLFDLLVFIRSGNVVDLSGTITFGAAGASTLNFGAMLAGAIYVSGGIIFAEGIAWNPANSNAIALTVQPSSSNANIESRLVGYTIEKIIAPGP